MSFASNLLYLSVDSVTKGEGEHPHYRIKTFRGCLDLEMPSSLFITF